MAVFDDTVKNVSNYTRITATAQVTQTPSLVIVDRRGSAQVQTGYLDFETIDQFVDDARASAPSRVPQPAVCSRRRHNWLRVVRRAPELPAASRADRRRRRRSAAPAGRPAVIWCGLRSRSEGGRIADVDLRRRGLRRDARGCQRLLRAGLTAPRCSRRPRSARTTSPPSWAGSRRGSSMPPISPRTRCTARCRAVSPGGEPLLADRSSRVLVAMSGGVDSAAAAMLEQRAGREVVAVTLKLWADPETDGERSCCSPQAVLGARALAHSMGLPHLTLDLRTRFRAAVVDHYICRARPRADAQSVRALQRAGALRRDARARHAARRSDARHRALRADRTATPRARCSRARPIRPRTRRTCCRALDPGAARPGAVPAR